ncbi:MAG TPA: O-antigen ligase family protein [Verrucomicrobiae bacterium]|nr:O-antigen ligase family protein [Verrucomicrobiae bacterium]
MNQAETRPGLGVPVVGAVARRDPHPTGATGAGHVLRTSRMSWVAVALFIGLHLPLALLMKFVPAVGTLHALAALAIGIKWAWSGREVAKVSYVGAYITGSEIIWRAVGASVFWEYGKYALVLLFVVALVRSHRLRFPPLPTLYFLLLIPAALITVVQVSLSEARNMLSFNLSGPLALAVSVVFFRGLKLSRRQFLRLMVGFIAPIVGMVAIILLGFATTEVTFGHESSAAASGGFGANQVSALLGMGCVAAFLCVLDNKLRWELKVLFFGLVLEFAMQSALTFSRAGVYYAATSITIACLLLMKHLRAALQVSVALVLLFLLAYYVVYPRLDEFTGGALSARFENTHLTGRAEIMDADLKIMEEHPIFGIGVGQAMHERARFFKGFAAHTEFTRLLSEHGSLGCVAALLLVVMGIRNVLAAVTNRGRAVAASLVTYSFCFMTGNGMRMVLPAFVFGLAAVTLVPDQRPARRGHVSGPVRLARPNRIVRALDGPPHRA